MDVLKVLTIVLSGGLFIVIIELIRKGRLKERYALLWLFAGLVMLLFASSRTLLEGTSRLFHIFYPPSFLFLLAFLFLLMIALHFSTVISRLSEQNKKLAQEIALLRQEMQERMKTVTTG